MIDILSDMRETMASVVPGSTIRITRELALDIWPAPPNPDGPDNDGLDWTAIRAFAAENRCGILNRDFESSIVFSKLADNDAKGTTD